jgi:hypothetical protein
MAEGALDDIADGTMFIGLQRYYQQNGRWEQEEERSDNRLRILNFLRA